MSHPLKKTRGSLRPFWDEAVLMPVMGDLSHDVPWFSPGFMRIRSFQGLRTADEWSIEILRVC